MRRLYYRVRCWMGRPVCYRKYYDEGAWFAMCKACHRQSEIHMPYYGPEPK